MPYTLSQAARAAGRGKTTLLRAVRSGKLSATRDEVAGTWLIEPVELHRLYPPVPPGPVPDLGDGAPRTTERNDRTAELEARIVEMGAAQRLRDETIADLRRRLDDEAAERRRLTALLTGPGEIRRRRWRWWWGKG